MIARGANLRIAALAQRAAWRARPSPRRWPPRARAGRPAPRRSNARAPQHASWSHSCTAPAAFVASRRARVVAPLGRCGSTAICGARHQLGARTEETKGRREDGWGKEERRTCESWLNASVSKSKSDFERKRTEGDVRELGGASAARHPARSTEEYAPAPCWPSVHAVYGLPAVTSPPARSGAERTVRCGRMLADCNARGVERDGCDAQQNRTLRRGAPCHHPPT